MTSFRDQGMALLSRFSGFGTASSPDARSTHVETATSSAPKAFTVGGGNNGSWYADKASRRDIQQANVQANLDAQAVRDANAVAAATRHRREHLKNNLMWGAAIAAVVGTLVTGAAEVAEYEAGIPNALFACQSGDGRVGCVPVLDKGGKWSMATLSTDGSINNPQSMLRVPVLMPAGIEFRPLVEVRTGKSSRMELNIPGSGLVPVLMPDGTLSVAPGNGDHLRLDDACKIAASANPAQPEAMIDTVLSRGSMP